ncbi:hypothetical protein, partial [Mycobacterium marinum]
AGTSGARDRSGAALTGPATFAALTAGAAVAAIHSRVGSVVNANSAGTAFTSDAAVAALAAGALDAA